MDDTKVILVTGASSGIGRVTAERLASEGYIVFGTSRRASAADDFEMLKLDVTSDASVAACVQTVLDKAGRLDVLINNAGADLPGAVEEIPIDEAKWLFETNFFGMVRMVKAVLPIMRAQGGGQILNLSSALGRVGVGFETYYTATKHAVEGFSESLRHEVKPFGIHVSIVEPGFFKSEIRTTEQVGGTRIAAYAGDRRKVVEGFDQRVEQGRDPIEVARAIHRIIETRSPGVRYPVGSEAVGVAMARRFAPNWMLEKYMRWSFGLDDWREDAPRYASVGAAAAAAAVGTLALVLGLARRR